MGSFIDVLIITVPTALIAANADLILRACLRAWQICRSYPIDGEAEAALAMAAIDQRQYHMTNDDRPMRVSGSVSADEEKRVDDRPVDPVRDRVDAVIGDLGRRAVSQKDKERLGDALDAADRPSTTRADADHSVGQAITRPRSP